MYNINQAFQPHPQYSQYGQPQYPQYQQNQQVEPNRKRYEVWETANFKQVENYIPEPFVCALFVNTQTGEIYKREMGGDCKTRTFFYELNESAVKPKDPMEEMRNEITRLRNELEEMRNDKSVSNDGRNAKPDGNASKSNAGKNEKPEPSAVPKGNGND